MFFLSKHLAMWVRILARFLTRFLRYLPRFLGNEPASLQGQQYSVYERMRSRYRHSVIERHIQEY